MPLLRKVISSQPALVFPNPSSAMVSVRFEEPVSELVVLAADGQRMHHDAAPATDYSFNVSQWPAGIYLIQASSGQEMVTQKLSVGL
jgi:hypothetical protein